MVAIMMMNSINDWIKCKEGRAEEMQIRVLLHEIRVAADRGDMEVFIPLYKISKLHLPTLRLEVLELSGFKSQEYESSEIPGQKMLRICWS